MDIRKVKKLIELLEESGVSEIEIKEGEESVRISRHPTGVVHAFGAPPAYAVPAPAARPIPTPALLEKRATEPSRSAPAVAATEPPQNVVAQ